MSLPISRRCVLQATASCVVAASLPVFAQATLLSPEAMQADVALLRTAYTTLHPGLLRYNSERDIADAFNHLSTRLAQPTSLGDAYLDVSRVLSSIRCGHSYANFYNQSKAVQAELFDHTNRLPLHFVWLGERMIVISDPARTGIAPGSEILAIDGRPSATVLRSLLAVARADGHNDAKRRALMSVGGGEEYESVDIFFPLLFGSRASYSLSVRAPNGKHRAERVAAISLADRRAQRIGNIPAADGALWIIERRGGAAILTMRNWSVFNSKWDWQAWLGAEFETLARTGATGLVIDIRDNEGGLDCGNAVIARLIDRPIALTPMRRLVRYRRVPDALRAHLETWDPSFATLGEQAVRYDDRFFALPSAGEDQTIAPKGARFKGKVAVLIGPQNSSATFVFAQVMRRERLATLIGETTGGNQSGINGGAFFFLKLPRTGIEVDVPLIGSFPLMPAPDAGLTPDIAVPRTAEAIALGRDDAMAHALAEVA